MISLPAGYTAEYFIKYLRYYKNNWQSSEVQQELAEFNIPSNHFPDTTNLKFVQQGEYYPISPQHPKSNSNYIKQFYLELLELKPENILLMDISSQGILAAKGERLIFREGKVDVSSINKYKNTNLKKWKNQAFNDVVDFCTTYEDKIRKWGGIGFFLADLGAKGTIAFNIPGTIKQSKTRLVKLNYATAAEAAIDLGGLEYVQGKGAITIGIETINFNKNAIIIICASNLNKSKCLKDLVEKSSSVELPASLLQDNNIKVYAAQSVVGRLANRNLHKLKEKIKNGWQDHDLDNIIINIALKENKKIMQLTVQELAKYDEGKLLLEDYANNLSKVLAEVKQRILVKLEKGIQPIVSQKILHTASCPDTIFLAYYPMLTRLLNNKNYFAYIGSRGEEVTDKYLMRVLQGVNEQWLDENKKYIFNVSKKEIMEKFNIAYRANDKNAMRLQNTILNLKNVIYLYKISDVQQLKKKLRWLKDEYFPNKLPGSSDIQDILLLKGLLRETENKTLLSDLNINIAHIKNLRAVLDMGTQYVASVLYLYNLVNPDIITIADTIPDSSSYLSFAVKHLLTQALAAKQNIEHIRVFGYRAIWHKYHISEANTFIPISAEEQTEYKNKYRRYFASQKNTPYPSPFSTNDFITICVKEQSTNLANLKILLGKNYFTKNKNLRLRNAVGIIYMREMAAKEFITETQNFKIDERLAIGHGVK